MIISASKAREKLFPLIEQVNADQASITITSNNGRIGKDHPVVDEAFEVDCLALSTFNIALNCAFRP